MQKKNRIKAGSRPTNHNETLGRVQKPITGLKVKTNIKAGCASNYSRIAQDIN